MSPTDINSCLLTGTVYVCSIMCIIYVYIDIVVYYI